MRSQAMLDQLHRRDLSRKATRVAVLAALFLVPASPGRLARQTPQFLPHEVATGLTGGYQVVAADLNRDGKPDLIAVASGLPTLIWYENPTWTPHVLGTGFRGLINVAATDLDGDGIPEIAIAYGFSTNPGQSEGNIALLTHGANVAEPWSIREIDRVPSAHRLRWLTTGSGEKFLINSPLAAATAQPPAYAGSTPIYFYRAPEWKRELLTNEEQGVVHAIEPVTFKGEVVVPGSAPVGQRLFSAGFAGIHLQEWSHGAWTRNLLAAGDPSAAPKGGSSDVATGMLVFRSAARNATVSQRFLASIEPWHGNQVVIYREQGEGWGPRTVIDTTVVDGHALVAADLDGDGSDEVIVGQRGGTRSVWIFTASDIGPARGGATERNVAWTRTTLDSGGMAAAGCAAVDLNGDGRIDLACIGTATANLKWYENVKSRHP